MTHNLLCETVSLLTRAGALHLPAQIGSGSPDYLRWSASGRERNPSEAFSDGLHEHVQHKLGGQRSITW